MKKINGFGLVLLLTILALSSGLASAEGRVNEGIAAGSSDHANSAGSVANESGVLSRTTNMAGALNSTNLTNATALANSTKLKNVATPENSTTIKNSTVLENLTFHENSSTKNGVMVNASAAPFESGPSGKAVFVIDNGIVPLKNAGNTGQASVNGASLMRAVDGTPHGYTTYYN